VAVARAVKVEMEPEARLRLCTAEDLIVMKAFADRPQDRLDLRGILVRQGTEALDWHYIWECLTPLAVAKESPVILSHLQSLQEAIREKEVD
jgi:predicted nucleotidyltransferase